MVSASYDRILRSWDIETGKQLRTFSGHSQSTLAIAYDSTGNTIASGCVILSPCRFEKWLTPCSVLKISMSDFGMLWVGFAPTL